MRFRGAASGPTVRNVHPGSFGHVLQAKDPHDSPSKGDEPVPRIARMIEDPEQTRSHPDRPRRPGISRRAAIGAIGLAASGPSAAETLPKRSRPGETAVATRSGEDNPAHPRPRDERYEVLEVGPGKRFPSLTLAGCFMNSAERWNGGHTSPERIARMRFRLIISPGPRGYYTNDSGSHSRRWKELVGWPPYEGNLLGPVIIEGEPGKAPPVLDTDGYGDDVLFYQKGLFCTGNFDATFRNLIFRGFRRRDGYGNFAAIRLGESFLPVPVQSRVTIEDCEISGCDNGVMGGLKGQAVTIRRCYIHDNGNQTGRVHNVYVGYADSLVVDRLLSTRCTIGHLLKTRAGVTVIRNSRLLGGAGSESACLDVPNAGILDVAALICDKSEDSDAHWIIHYAGENQDAAGMPFHQLSSIRLRNLTLLAPSRLRRHEASRVQGFANQSGAGSETSGRDSRFIAADAQNIQVHGLAGGAVGLPYRALSQRPALDLRSPVAG